MPTKEATTGVNLKIYVHFDGAEKTAGSVVADTLETLRDKIKEKFSDDTRKFPAPDKLIVQIKDAENKFHSLDNDPELELADALKCDSGGKYRVYVEPEGEAPVETKGPTFEKMGKPTLEKIANRIRTRDPSVLRTNLDSDPTALPPCQLTRTDFGDFIGLKEASDKIVAISTTVERGGRPRVGMLNAPPGSGKSALFQFAEEHIPATHPKIAVMALTFNCNSSGDKGNRYGYGPAEGLMLRIAARYFCAPDCFDEFRALWMSDPELRELSLFGLLKLVIVPFQAKFNRLLILIDESRLAGPNAEYREEEDKLKAQKAPPDVIAAALESIIGRAVYNATADWRHSLNVPKFVNFVFSSLKPVYDEAGLMIEALSGSPITWIDVVPAGNSARSVLKQRIIKLLAERTPKKHRDKSADFLIVMASGHWVSLWQLIERVREISPITPTIKYDAIRQAVVSREEYVAEAPNRVPQVFGELIKMSLFHECKDPYASWNIRGWETSLVQLAFSHLILNSIRAKKTQYLPIIPKLSLLDVEKYCANSEDVPLCDKPLAEAVDKVLKVSGQSERDMDASDDPSWRALEHLTAAFIHTKFVAWKQYYHEKAFLPFANASDQTDAFFSGHRFAYGDPNLIMKLPKESRVLHVSGTGFRLPKQKPSMTMKKPSVKKPRVKKPKVTKNALEALVFEEKVDTLQPGDIILPGITTQPFCDCAVISELKRGKEISNCINFIQVKFSEKTAETKLTVATAVSALTKLLKERGVLFDCRESAANQFARLGVERRMSFCPSPCATCSLQTHTILTRNSNVRLQNWASKEALSSWKIVRDFMEKHSKT